MFNVKSQDHDIEQTGLVSNLTDVDFIIMLIFSQLLKGPIIWTWVGRKKILFREMNKKDFYEYGNFSNTQRRPVANKMQLCGLRENRRGSLFIKNALGKALH